MTQEQVNEVSNKGQKRGIELNTEGKVYQYFTNKGYNIIQGKLLTGERGVPDFFCRKNDNDKFFIEVKDKAGSLTMFQINWMSECDDKVYVGLEDYSGNMIFYEMTIKKVKL
jgi:hypothetical protein